MSHFPFVTLPFVTLPFVTLPFVTRTPIGSLLSLSPSSTLETLRAATRVLGAMASRAAARRVMRDPDTAEGLMHVLSFPDSSSSRVHLAVISALAEMKDAGTVANLLAVAGAADTFWREAHSRNTEVQGPSRSLLALAFSAPPCRRRLGLRERTKRLVDLLQKITEQAPVGEEYLVAPIDAEKASRRAGEPHSKGGAPMPSPLSALPPAADGDEADLEIVDEIDDPDAEYADEDENDDGGAGGVAYSLRLVASLDPEPTRVLTAMLDGLSAECESDPSLIEALTRHGAWDWLNQASRTARAQFVCALAHILMPRPLHHLPPMHHTLPHHAAILCFSLEQHVLARPPLSASALRLVRLGAGGSHECLERIVALGLPLAILQCRESSEHSAGFNANLAETLKLQNASDDALQILGFAANQGGFHAAADLHPPARLVHRFMRLLGGANPSDAATCAGCHFLEFLIRSVFSPLVCFWISFPHMSHAHTLTPATEAPFAPYTSPDDSSRNVTNVGITRAQGGGRSGRKMCTMCLYRCT